MNIFNGGCAQGMTDRERAQALRAVAAENVLIWRNLSSLGHIGKNPGVNECYLSPVMRTGGAVE